jgi:hypothetical protein
MEAAMENPMHARTVIDWKRYLAVQEAIYASLPPGSPPITWMELAEQIAPRLPESLFRHGGTVRWYTRAVWLAMEANGELVSISKDDLRKQRVVA